MAGHGSWRLGPGARRRIVEEVKAGMSQKRAAARFCVSPATVNRWVRREREATPEELESGAWAQDRPSRPHRTPGDDQRGRARPDLRDARAHRLGPAVDRAAGRPAALDRPRGVAPARLFAQAQGAQESVVRYEWPCPGQLLHVDVKKFGRFSAPGHKVTGDRTQRSRRVGWDYAHSLVDDCSRLAYTELHDDERAATVTAFIERALDWFLEHGIVAERLLSDNAWAYTHNRSLRALLCAPRDRAQDDPALPPPDQRQGRALAWIHRIMPVVPSGAEA